MASITGTWSSAIRMLCILAVSCQIGLSVRSRSAPFLRARCIQVPLRSLDQRPAVNDIPTACGAGLYPPADFQSASCEVRDVGGRPIENRTHDTILPHKPDLQLSKIPHAKRVFSANL